MRSTDREAAILAYLEAHKAEWDAYLALPWQERAAMQDKVQAATDAGGAQAGRDMMRALRMPTLPDELCDPPEVLNARGAGRRGVDAGGRPATRVRAG